ncbi:MAG TPA: MBOAT family O-acyltransferase [Actinomycetota bacterium]|nr:MBOAT family O-acyltransferase [Actinomycetota bacterium]
MLFPTVDFAIFFVLVFTGHWLLNHVSQPWKFFMIGASYVFYAWWDWRFVLLLVGVSVLAQLGAIAVARSRPPRAKLVMNAIAVTLLLLPLAFFKYYGFLAVNVTNALTSVGIESSIPLIQVVLPVGISFFTFMAIAYVVDVYRGDFEVASWTDTFLYLSFFPHLVAGPIVRPNELIPQLQERRDERHVDVAGAAWLILGGLFKKVVVSSYLAAQIVDPVFGDPARRSAPDALLGILGYAIVIYADFSGYTDIAIGIAKMLGFQFPRNFDRPYAARSIQDFWRRWHMTLSRWLRDYLYIPLGGNRRGERRTYANVMITMILGGLWHGAAWTFVFWGAYHGALLAAHQWRARPGNRDREPSWIDGLRQRAGTFALVCVGWVFFRADSMDTAFSLLRRLISGWWTPSEFVTPLVVFTIAGMLALQFWPRGLGLWLQSGMSRLKPAPLGIVFGLALLVIVILGPPGVAPFIYFQF